MWSQPLASAARTFPLTSVAASLAAAAAPAASEAAITLSANQDPAALPTIDVADGVTRRGRRHLAPGTVLAWAAHRGGAGFDALRLLDAGRRAAIRLRVVPRPWAPTRSARLVLATLAWRTGDPDRCRAALGALPALRADAVGGR